MGGNVLLARRIVRIGIHLVAAVAAERPSLSPWDDEALGGFSVVQDEQLTAVKNPGDLLKPRLPQIGGLCTEPLREVLEHFAYTPLDLRNQKGFLKTVLVVIHEHFSDQVFCPREDSQGQGVEKFVGQDHSLERFEIVQLCRPHHLDGITRKASLQIPAPWPCFLHQDQGKGRLILAPVVQDVSGQLAVAGPQLQYRNLFQVGIRGHPLDPGSDGAAE